MAQTRLTPSSQLRYNELMGIGQPREPGQVGHGQFPRAMGPTIIKVADPMQPLEDLAEAVMEGDPEGRKANRKLRRRSREQEKVSVDEHGRKLLYGKACCFDAMLTLNRQLERLELPFPFTCGACGTIFSIEMRIREERRHV